MHQPPLGLDEITDDNIQFYSDEKALIAPGSSLTNTEVKNRAAKVGGAGGGQVGLLVGDEENLHQVALTQYDDVYDT